MYHELIIQTVRYVHATTILCSYCNYNNFDNYEIIKHAADKIVTDGTGYTWIYWQFMYTMFVFLNKHVRLSIIIVVLENNLLHTQFETIMSHKFSKE